MNKTAAVSCHIHPGVARASLGVSMQGTSSAGYSRLKHGIRGTRGYPTAGGVASQQRPHANTTVPGPPTAGHS